jgi:hypothetical protein
MHSRKPNYTKGVPVKTLFGFCTAVLALGVFAAPIYATSSGEAPDPQKGAFAAALKKDPPLQKRYRLLRQPPQKLGQTPVGDGLELYDGTMTSGSPTLHSASAKFLSTDVNKVIYVRGAGNTGNSNWLNGTIVSYQSPTDVTLSTSALNAVSGALFDYGTDNTPIINAMTNAYQLQDPNLLYTPHSGRLFHFPSGMYLLSGIVYARGGDVFSGDGVTGTEFVNFDPNYFDPLVRLGANAVTGLSDHSGLDSAVVGILFRTSETESAAVDTMDNAGWDVRNCWFLSGVGIIATGTDGIITENTFDKSTAQGIIVRGNGQSWNMTHSILISNNRFYAQWFAGIQLDGTGTINILNNYFNYIRQYSIYTSSNGANYRVTIAYNNFTGSLSDNFSNASMTHIQLSHGLVDSKIIGNTFAVSRLYDIFLDDPSITNLQIANNTSENINGTSIRVQAAGSGVSITNNKMVTPGNYAGDFDVGLDLEGNSCSNPFSETGLPQNEIDRACFRFNAGASGIIARNNTTDSTVVAAVSLHAGSALDNLSGNQSNWPVGDAFVGPGTGMVASNDERDYNDGGSGTIFTTEIDPTTGDASFSGTITDGSSQVQVTNSNGNLLATALVGLYVGTVTTALPGAPVAFRVSPAPTHCWYAPVGSSPPADPPPLTYLPYVTIQGNVVTFSSSVAPGSRFDMYCVYN